MSVMHVLSEVLVEKGEFLRVMEIESQDLIAKESYVFSLDELMILLEAYYIITVKDNLGNDMLIFPHLFQLGEDRLCELLLEQAHLLNKPFDFIDWLEDCVFYVRK